MRTILILGLICFIFCATVGAQELDTGRCGSLYDLNDKEVNLADYKGKPTILLFWTTWCPYCRKALLGLNDIYQELQASGIELFAINVNERLEKVNRFLKTYSLEFTILRDSESECAFSYGLIGVPTYLLINREGKVVFQNNYFPKNKYKKLLLE